MKKLFIASLLLFLAVSTASATQYDDLAWNVTNPHTGVTDLVLDTEGVSNLTVDGVLMVNGIQITGQNSGDSNTPWLTASGVIYTNDNVGINTSSPSADFDVNGSIEGSSITSSFENVLEAALDHDDLNGYVANEHIDWTQVGAGTIDSSNYTDNNTTYTAGTGLALSGTQFTTNDAEIVHDNLSGFVANEHIDWTIDQGAVNIHSGNYTDTDTTYDAGTGMSLDGTTFNCTVTDTNTTYSAGTGLDLSGTTFSTNDSEIVHDNLNGFVANEHIDWTTDQGATNIDPGNYVDTDTTYSAGTGMSLTGTTFDCTVVDTNTTYTAGTGLALSGTEFSTDDAAIVHDNLSGFVANEHIDWTVDQGATNIHSGNYTDTDTTYSAGTGMSLDGTTFNCTVTDTDTTYSAGTGMSLSGTTFNCDIVDASDLSDIDTSGAVSGKVLKYNGTTWVVGDDNSGSGGGGAGAATDNAYIMASSASDLTQERVLVASSPLSATDGGAEGSFTIAVASGYTIPTDTEKGHYDTAYTHSQTTTGNPHNLDYSDIGLDSDQVIDWTASSAGTIHSSNYVDNDTTYSAGTGMSLSGTTFNCTVTDTDTTYSAGTGLNLVGTTFSTNDSEIVHDNLSGFVANEHIDWTQSNAGTIHASNYVDNDTTYTAGTNMSLVGSTFNCTIQDHNDLDNKQGGATGEYYHLSYAQHTDLTDGGDSSLHYHSADRNRANHTGTQTASTISDFDTEVSNNPDVAANTAKVSNATHTGEVTGSTTLTIADNVIDEANMKISNSPTDDYVLTADSSETGGWKWAAASGGGAWTETGDNSTTGNLSLGEALTASTIYVADSLIFDDLITFDGNMELYGTLSISKSLTVNGNIWSSSNDANIDGVVYGGNIGFIRGFDIDYISSSSITISGGACVCKDKYVANSSDTAQTISVFSNGSFTYIYVDYSASTSSSIVFTNTTTSPSWDSTYDGWYNGDDRCIAAFYCDSSSTIQYFTWINNGRLGEYWYKYANGLQGNGNPNSAWQNTSTSCTIYTPTNACDVFIEADSSDTNGAIQIGITSYERGQQGINYMAADIFGSSSQDTVWTQDSEMGWVHLGSSRKIMWYGYDAADNSFSVRLSAYRIKR